MADRIEGIALLLSPKGDPASEYLEFFCVRANGDRKPWNSHIPVYPVGTPNPLKVAWEYRDLGNGRLEVKPSVRMSYLVQHQDDGTPLPKERWHDKEYFHNDGKWEVRFERWPGDPDDYGPGGIWDRLRELNPQFPM